MVWNPLKSLRSSKGELFIDLDDAHHVYRPGESVTGRVIAELGRNHSQATISVGFKGRLKIRGRKPQLKAQESVIFNDRVVLSEGKVLNAGKHAFPFELELPEEGLLESIDFDVGNISYVIRGSLEVNKEELQHTHRAIKVATIRDVTNYSAPKAVVLVVDTSKKRKKDTKIVINLNVPHKGWTPGEHIPIRLTIQHQWDVQSPASIAVTLSRITQFIVGDSEYTYRKDLDQSILGLYTHPSTQTAELTTNLAIPPDSLITASTDIIKFSYLIEATIDLSGKLDLGNWANSNPAVKIIDTDRVRNRPGVVTSWAEIIMGTHRSDYNGSQMGSRTETASDVAQTANVDAPSSMESTYSQRNSRNSQSQGSSTSVSPPATADTAAATEKMVLATRAQTLIPSVPEYPQPQPLPSAPLLSNRGYQPVFSDDKDLMRLQQLVSEPAPESAPAYSPRGDAAPPSISAPTAPFVPNFLNLTVSAPPQESLEAPVSGGFTER